MPKKERSIYHQKEKGVLSLLFRCLSIARKKNYTVIVACEWSNRTFSFHISYLCMVVLLIVITTLMSTSLVYRYLNQEQKPILYEYQDSIANNYKLINEYQEYIHLLEGTRDTLQISILHIVESLVSNRSSDLYSCLSIKKDNILTQYFTAGKDINDSIIELRNTVNDGVDILLLASNINETLSEVMRDLPTLWPIKSGAGYLTGRFGCALSSFTGYGYIHLGTDIGYGYGIPIVATADGIILEENFSYNNYGNYVLIAHKYGFKTKFGHLQRSFVKPGDSVKQGDVIGTMGNTGKSTGPHLHYEIHMGSEYLDPQIFLGIENDISTVRQ